MDENLFDDERYLQYCQEHRPMPQYISYLEEQALKHPKVIYISYEETEEEDVDKNTLSGNDANIRVAPRDERVTGAVRCTECQIPTTVYENNLLSSISYIYGSSRAYCLERASEREVTDVIKWLVTGKILSCERPDRPSYQVIVDRLAIQRYCMVKRVIKKKCDGSALVKTNELFRLCLEIVFKCAVLGHYVYFHHDIRIPHWALSLDHIDPLYYNRTNPASWSVNNLQLLSSVLNTIKGSVSNEELLRWHANFMASKVIEL